MKIKRVTAKRRVQTERREINNRTRIGFEVVRGLYDFIIENHTDIATAMADDDVYSQVFYGRITDGITLCDFLKAALDGLCIEADLIRFNANKL